MVADRESVEVRLLKDIAQTGFPAELAVSSVLAERSWDVRTQEYFVDRDTGTGREIDCSARLVTIDRDRTPPVQVVTHVYAEVKKSTKPWVVFTSPKSTAERSLTGTLVAVQNVVPKTVTDAFKAQISTHAHGRYGRAVHVAFTTNSATAFGAIVSASKAALEGHRAAPEAEGFWSDNSHDALLYHPIVVVDGQIWECHLDEGGKTRISRASAVPFRFNYKSAGYSDHYACHVDIVSLDYLDEYSRNVEQATEAVIRAVAEVG